MRSTVDHVLRRGHRLLLLRATQRVAIAILLSFGSVRAADAFRDPDHQPPPPPPPTTASCSLREVLGQQIVLQRIRVTIVETGLNVSPRRRFVRKDYTLGRRAMRQQLRYPKECKQRQFPLEVVAGPLDHITLNGPDEVEATSTTEYEATGYDRYDNPIQLLENSIAFHAPSAAGLADVTATQDGVFGVKRVRVVAGPTVRILLDGPMRLCVGTTARYRIDRRDKFDNSIHTEPTSFLYQAPTIAGPITVSYAERGVTGNLNIQVCPGPLAGLALRSDASILNDGQTTRLHASTVDRYANLIESLRPHWSTTSGIIDDNGTLTIGSTDAHVTATAGNITAHTTVHVDHDLLVSPTPMTYPITLPTDTITIDVTVVYRDGTPVAGACVTITVDPPTSALPLPPIQLPPLLRFTPGTSCTTGPNGTAHIELSGTDTTPGCHHANAHASKASNAGNAPFTYRVGTTTAAPCAIP